MTKPGAKKKRWFGVCHEHRGKTDGARLMRLFDAMLAHTGPLHWWPAKTPFEVCVGAILTQNTAWSNVEKAIASLESHDLLSADAIAYAPRKKLAAAIRSSGYFNQKAERLQDFARYLFDRWGGKVEATRAAPTEELRAELLALKGIGPETADSILLYAVGKPIFVVDAYTKRIFHRKGVFREDAKYEDVRAFFEKHLARDAALFNEYHAQVVRIGNRFCRKTNPRCEECPVRGL